MLKHFLASSITLIEMNSKTILFDRYKLRSNMEDMPLFVVKSSFIVCFQLV